MVFAVPDDAAVGAVRKISAPDPPVPVPLLASIVRFAPAMSAPDAAAPRIVVAVGEPASPTPKIKLVPDTWSFAAGPVVPIPTWPVASIVICVVSAPAPVSVWNCNALALDASVAVVQIAWIRARSRPSVVDDSPVNSSPVPKLAAGVPLEEWFNRAMSVTVAVDASSVATCRRTDGLPVPSPMRLALLSQKMALASAWIDAVLLPNKIPPVG